MELTHYEREALTHARAGAAYLDVYAPGWREGFDIGEGFNVQSPCGCVLAQLAQRGIIGGGLIGGPADRGHADYFDGRKAMGLVQGECVRLGFDAPSWEHGDPVSTARYRFLTDAWRAVLLFPEVQP